METHDYFVDVRWDHDRIGSLSSPDLEQSIQVATPPQFNGGVPDIWSPEHLFTASVVSCFMTTFLAIAEFSKLEFHEFRCRAKGVLGKPGGKFGMIQVVLHAQLGITDPALIDRARRLLEKSEKSCLISQSIKSETILETEILVLSPIEKV